MWYEVSRLMPLPSPQRSGWVNLYEWEDEDCLNLSKIITPTPSLPSTPSGEQPQKLYQSCCCLQISGEIFPIVREYSGPPLSYYSSSSPYYSMPWTQLLTLITDPIGRFPSMPLSFCPRPRPRSRRPPVKT